MHSLIVSLVLLASCDSDGNPCDKDQKYLYGLCYELDAAPADNGGPDAQYAHYGDVCDSDAACAAPTNYCAIQPGDSIGYCTHTGCIEMPTACPANWTCLDLSVFQPGLPAMCKKP